eukprot:365803-Chlamydomonas_euryale.AAC.14
MSCPSAFPPVPPCPFTSCRASPQRRLRTHQQQALEDVDVSNLGVAHNSAPRLDRLDDLGRLVACERKARRGRVDLHGAAQRLLRAPCHGVCLVQDDDLVAAGRQRDLLLRKHLDLVAHHVNASAGDNHGPV